MKRQRGRNRGGGGNAGNGGGGKPQQNVNRAFDSNGPDNIKIRGHAQHVFEKYQQLARDSFSSGDRVLAENYLQHADHYFRVLRALQPQRPPSEILGRDVFASGLDIDFEDEGEGFDETGETGGGDGDLNGTEQPRQDRYEPRADARREDRYEPRQDRREERYDTQRNGGGRDYGMRDSGNRDQGRDTPQRDFQARDPQSRDGQSRDGLNRDGQARDGQGRDGNSREGQGRDAQGRDGQYRETAARDADGREPRRYEDGRRDGQEVRRDNRRPEGRRDREYGEDRSRTDRPREDRSVDGRSGPGRETDGAQQPTRTDPLVVVEPQAHTLPFEPPSAAGPDASPLLRSEDGGVSEAPAFLQASSPTAAQGEDTEPRRPRPRRRKVKADEGGDTGSEAASADAVGEG